VREQTRRYWKEPRVAWAQMEKEVRGAQQEDNKAAVRI
jgi:hypothetical protein